MKIDKKFVSNLNKLLPHKNTYYVGSSLKVKIDNGYLHTHPDYRMRIKVETDLEDGIYIVKDDMLLRDPVQDEAWYLDYRGESEKSFDCDIPLDALIKVNYHDCTTVWGAKIFINGKDKEIFGTDGNILAIIPVKIDTDEIISFERNSFLIKIMKTFKIESIKKISIISIEKSTFEWVAFHLNDDMVVYIARENSKMPDYKNIVSDVKVIYFCNVEDIIRIKKILPKTIKYLIINSTGDNIEIRALDTSIKDFDRGICYHIKTHIKSSSKVIFKFNKNLLFYLFDTIKRGECYIKDIGNYLYAESDNGIISMLMAFCENDKLTSEEHTKLLKEKWNEFDRMIELEMPGSENGLKDFF